MASYIYLVTNIINNKCYIGKTNNKNIRWSQHKSKSKNNNSYFYNAIRKYGTQSFSFEIIKECETEEDAYEYERVLIELFSLRNRKYGYNIIEGGSGGSKGYKVKESLKQYFSKKYVGTNSVRSKFLKEDIYNILNDYSSCNFTTEFLSQKYNCSKSTIIRIISGKSYSNIEFDRSNFKEISKINKIKNTPHGINVKTHKLSDNDVINIRKLYSTGDYSYNDLSKKFNVSKTNIYFIINNLSRK